MAQASDRTSYYAVWDAFDVAAELRGADEAEQSDRVEASRRKQATSIDRIVQEVGDLAAAAASRADVAALRASGAGAGRGRRRGRRSGAAAHSETSAPSSAGQARVIAAARAEAGRLREVHQQTAEAARAAAAVIGPAKAAGIWAPVYAADAGCGGGGPRGHMLAVERDARSARLAMDVATGRRGKDAFEFAGEGGDDYEREFGKRGGPGVLYSPATAVSVRVPPLALRCLGAVGGKGAPSAADAAAVRAAEAAAVRADAAARAALAALDALTSADEGAMPGGGRAGRAVGGVGEGVAAAEGAGPGGGEDGEEAGEAADEDEDGSSLPPPSLVHWQRPASRLASELHWRGLRTRRAIGLGCRPEDVAGIGGGGFASLARRRRRGSGDSDGLSMPAGAREDDGETSGEDDVDAVAVAGGAAPADPGALLRAVLTSPLQRRLWRRACRSAWRVAAGACVAAGAARLALGDPGGSAAALREALLVDGASAAAWTMRAKAFAAMGAIATAELHADRALQLEGGEPEHVGASLPVPAPRSGSVAGPGAGEGGVPWELGSPGAEVEAVEAARRDAAAGSSASPVGAPPPWLGAAGAAGGASAVPARVLATSALLADVLLCESATACKVLCLRLLAATAGLSDDEWIAWDVPRLLARAGAVAAVAGGDGEDGSGGLGGRAEPEAEPVAEPGAGPKAKPEAAEADAAAGPGDTSGRAPPAAAALASLRAACAEWLPAMPGSASSASLLAASRAAQDDGRALFGETFVRSAGRKFSAALVLAAAASARGEHAGVEEVAALWLNLSSSLLRRASGGGSGSNARLCARALLAASLALDALCDGAAAAGTGGLADGSSQAAPSAASRGEADAVLSLPLPGRWLPVVVASTLPRMRAEAASGAAPRDSGELQAASRAGKALAGAVAARGPGGHRLAVKALFRAGQALAEAGALRQGAACLRGALVMCSLWVRGPAAASVSAAEFDGLASARRIRRELKRVRRTASAIGAF